MAFVRRKLAKPKSYTDAVLVLLEREPKNPFAVFDNQETNWHKFKDEVLEIWITESPGSRPRSWWQHEAPEARRKQLGGAGKIIPVLDHEKNHRYWKGVPAFRDYQDIIDPPVFESEASYLKRLGLFMPDEESRLSDQDYAPVVVKGP